MNIRTSWLATLTRRWHTNPLMCHVVDPIGGHGERVQILALGFWPDASRDLLKAIVYHDLAESILGDLPPEGKEMLRAAYLTAEKIVNDENGWTVDLDHTDTVRKEFCDKLDAYMMAALHRAAYGGDWEESWLWLKQSAIAMGKEQQLDEALGW